MNPQPTGRPHSLNKFRPLRTEPAPSRRISGLRFDSHLAVPGWLVASLALAAAILLGGCDRGQQGGPPPMGPAHVEVYVTKRENVLAVFEHIGQVEASQTVDVRARVEGVILEQGFEEGTSVTKDQFLFRIDPRPFEANLAIAEAKVVQQQVTVQSEQRNLARTQGLARSEAVSREEMEESQTRYNTAVAGLKLAEADHFKSELELSYTTVTASIAGRIGRAEKRTGDLVDNNENSLLCTINQQDPAWLIFHVSEREGLEYNRGVKEGKFILPSDGELTVSATLLDGSVYEHEGKINFYDVKIDPQTGTALVRAEVPNPASILVPGQFIKVQVRGATRPQMVRVPQASVQQGMQGAYVYVVDSDNMVEMRPVTTGQWDGDGWIIEAGLNAGEKIVTGGLLKVRPGAEVKVTTLTEVLQAMPLAPVNQTNSNGSTNGTPATNQAEQATTSPRTTESR